jgi:hypothetical protein
MMDTCQIVSGNELRRLQLYKQIFWLGWVVALIAFMFLVGTISQIQAFKASLIEIRKLKAEVLEVQQKQEAVNATYIKAWQNQQATADALISWGSYAMDRKKIADMNAGAVSTLVRRNNESPRSARSNGSSSTW